jgi:hypothetical protein
MERILFVTASAGGVVFGNLQHQDALRKSTGGSHNVFNTSSTRSVKVIAATMWRNLVCFPFKTRHNRPRNLRLPALPDRENINIPGIRCRRGHLKRHNPQYARTECDLSLRIQLGAGDLACEIHPGIG